MLTDSRELIQTTFEASSQGWIHFGQVIGQLMAAQVESYQVDYRAGRTTAYLPGGETLDLSFDPPKEAIADTFDTDAIRSAILDAQHGRVAYPESKHSSQCGGCVSCFVWIAGRHVTYYGRRGETHVERFPD